MLWEKMWKTWNNKVCWKFRMYILLTTVICPPGSNDGIFVELRFWLQWCTSLGQLSWHIWNNSGNRPKWANYSLAFSSKLKFEISLEVDTYSATKDKADAHMDKGKDGTWMPFLCRLSMLRSTKKIQWSTLQSWSSEFVVLKQEASTPAFTTNQSVLSREDIYPRAKLTDEMRGKSFFFFAHVWIRPSSLKLVSEKKKGTKDSHPRMTTVCRICFQMKTLTFCHLNLFADSKWPKMCSKQNKFMVFLRLHAHNTRTKHSSERNGSNIISTITLLHFPRKVCIIHLSRVFQIMNTEKGAELSCN